MKKPTIQKIILKNGLTIILCKTPSNLVRGDIVIKAGAIDDAPGKEGIAHFLEHCLANLAKRSSEISNLDFDTHASTTLISTAYGSRFFAEETADFLKVLAKNVIDPKFDKKIIESERKRIHLEVIEDLSEGAKINAYKGAILRDHPSNRDNEKDIIALKDISIKDLKEFHRRFYVARNAVIMIVGGFPNRIIPLIKTLFEKMPEGKKNKHKICALEPLKERKILHIQDSELYYKKNPKESQAEISLSFVVPSKKSKGHFTADLVANLLGGGSNSRLFKSLSCKKGLCYSTHAENVNLNEAGIIDITARIKATRKEEALKEIFNQLRLLRKRKLSCKELNKIKKERIFEICSDMEVGYGAAHLIRRALKKETTISKIRNFKKVTSKMILEFSKQYLPAGPKSNNYVLMIQDPLKNRGIK